MDDLIYVSRSLVARDEGQSAVAAIVQVARARNSGIGVTGALLYTGTHFVQLLEGEADALSELMLAIVADRRHTEVNVVDRGPIQARAFAGWAMAYYGSATYVQRYVNQLLVKNTAIEATAMASMRLLLQRMSGQGHIH